MLYIRQWGPILVGLLAAVSIVVGAQIALKPAADSKHSTTLTRVFAFGTGAFFSAVCLDFLPDAWSGNGGRTPLFIFLGAVAMWTATNMSDGLFDRDQKRQSVAVAVERDYTVAVDTNTEVSTGVTLLQLTPVSAIVLAAALAFHTFLEGAALSLAFHNLSWTTLGFSLAMILHKLPEGVLWGLALATVFPGNLSQIKRILLIPAICTMIGVFLGIFLANEASYQLVDIATGFVAGAMLYIAFAESLPALRESTRPGMTRSWFVVGLLAMFIINYLPSIFA